MIMPNQLNFKIMKTPRVFIISIAFATGLFFTSCKKDDKTNPKPVINLTELGYENSKIAYLGADLHIEAEIVAEGKINKVTIEIHPEGEHKKSASIVLHEGEWEIDTTYTEFSGLKNTIFHKHLDVSIHADTGHYHFHFIVTDMDGQQTLVEEDLEIKQPSDEVFPLISVATAPASDEVFANGQTISISGSVSDNIALGGLYIGLVRTDQGLTDAQVNDGNTITLLHTHEFDTPAEHSFSASIIIEATKDNNITPKDITGDIAWQSANYYIVVKCKDAFGGNWTFSDHYHIVINY